MGTLGGGTNEKAVVVLPVGYPAAAAQVPDLQRLAPEQFIQWNRPGPHAA